MPEPMDLMESSIFQTPTVRQVEVYSPILDTPDTTYFIYIRSYLLSMRVHDASWEVQSEEEPQ